MAKTNRTREDKKGPVKLYVPLDASHIEGVEPGQRVQVVIRNDAGVLQSRIVQMDKAGKSVAEFSFNKNPGALSIAVGPADAEKEEIFGLQTIQLSVNAKQWQNIKELKLAPVIISHYYWHWWLRWCRTFVIHGRVLCPDGSPVPGAVVTAFDVDAWWWWLSKEKVGSAVTDVTGSFTIKFKWCCGWWPWWWWRVRRWQLDPSIADRIHHLFYKYPLFPRPPLPDPAPDFNVFKHFIGEEELASLNIHSNVLAGEGFAASRTMKFPFGPIKDIDPGVLDPLREKLLRKIPGSEELSRYKIWPWWNWHPWWDCTPDIIFHVTQFCHLTDNVIVDETFFDARWNIPTSLNVTLVANDKACCIPQQPQPTPELKCALLTDVCYIGRDQIGGNQTPALDPPGYAYPGTSDRPFAGTVVIQGLVSDDIDYYSFEISDDLGATYHEMDPAAVGDFYREYWDPLPDTHGYPTFLRFIDGKRVYESRHHFETTNSPLSWGHSRYWMAGNLSTLMVWLTSSPFMNGEYQLKIRGWKLVAGHLVNLDFLDKCDTAVNDVLKIRIDNRLVGPGSGHPPSAPDHPCGTGTVHLCTMEPDTDFLSVKILHADSTETGIAACGSNAITDTDLLQIDFFAYDPEGHLSNYSLIATWGENLQSGEINALPGATVVPLSPAPVPAALQVGPAYANAIAQAAPAIISPTWAGGAMRLTVPAHLVFPETCCYQLELRAWKRTIVDCWGGMAHDNLSEYSFTITVLPQSAEVIH